MKRATGWKWAGAIDASILVSYVVGGLCGAAAYFDPVFGLPAVMAGVVILVLIRSRARRDSRSDSH